MKNRSTSILSTRELTILAVLTALCLILALYGSIPVGPLTITTGIIPVAIAAFAHVSNVLGTVNPVVRMTQLAHEHGALAVALA